MLLSFFSRLPNMLKLKNCSNSIICQAPCHVLSTLKLNENIVFEPSDLYTAHNHFKQYFLFQNLEYSSIYTPY